MVEKNISTHITYDYGDGITEKQWITKCVVKKVETATMTKEGSLFTGWSEKPNEELGEYVVNREIMFTEEKDYVTLYPSFMPIKNGYKETIENDGIIGKISKINESGIQTIKVLDEEYSANVIVIDRDLVLDGITEVEGATLNNNVYEFGDPTTDVATSSTYAQNTVVLKVNGNLVIDSDVTVRACASPSNYGGPKGLIVYCTATLINNGTISMTARGAKAKGQNVYLWENEDDSFETVPAKGANGGNSMRVGSSSSIIEVNGNAGNSGIGRETGGGGTGSGRTWQRFMGIAAGGAGTSYSGGAGSGAANTDGSNGWYGISGAGSSEGGAGGNGMVHSENTSGYGQISIGGTGNPSGSPAAYREGYPGFVWRHGTGGLLVIYANCLNNKYGIIEANGVSSSTSSLSNWNGRVDTGGASGGGSINVFYNKIKKQGTAVANGGTAIYGTQGRAGGTGGNGTVTFGNVSTGLFEKE